MLSKLIAGCFDFDSSAHLAYRINFRQNKLEFNVERSRLSKGDTNFWCRAPRLVNELPAAIDFFKPKDLLVFSGASLVKNTIRKFPAPGS